MIHIGNIMVANCKNIIFTTELTILSVFSSMNLEFNNIKYEKKIKKYLL